MHDTVNHEVRLARMGLGFNSASQLVFGIERIAVIWIGAQHRPGAGHGRRPDHAAAEAPGEAGACRGDRARSRASLIIGKGAIRDR